MNWTRSRRTAALGVLAGSVAVAPAAAGPAHASPVGPRPSGDAAAAKGAGPRTPPPPRLPRDFHGTGEWIVRDLGITVPFTWAGRDGNSQMIAGGPGYPIWFTNLIYENSLYTLTYKWPGLSDHRCSRIPGFDLGVLNRKLRTARFVGREILQRRPQRYVDHWRVGVVAPQLPPGKHLRFPIALGDVYVDQRDPTTFWQVLQFGLQNLYDPELDEWLVMSSFEHGPGRVALPRRCPPPAP
ncbi:hypothetical protein BKA00_001596 [Actinomadura coerulea]|uniref:Uncharacterized protein n=1 Tax=Actinomadura coerulea TaxID=46159 RepID=A0A7X0KXT9_9ACTN|nr:hypothetical protein [Actinomadura coerulea]MBB6394682.1 hypothetical protein [Actinomadura coerulea]GGQ36861.1 hypothetical protein GCM10010187_63080 [Actinomadura coerulea]